MKLKINTFIVCFLIVFIIFSYLITSRKSTDHILILPTDKKILVCNDSIRFRGDPFSKRIKVVTYLKDDAISEIPQWIPYIKKYPDISFIFYFNSGNPQYVIEGLKHFCFPLPVFWDTESKYKDYGLICFVVNETNEIIETTNPTLPNFDKLLMSLSKNNNGKE